MSHIIPAIFSFPCKAGEGGDPRGGAGLALLLSLLLAAPTAMAEGGGVGAWSPRLYALPAKPAPVMASVPDGAACIKAILAAEREAGITDNRLLAMGFTEAGRKKDGLFTVWPWTVTAEGQGRFFPDRRSAMEHVRSLTARGVASVDVGCLQVNLRWHPAAFPDLETAFDPAANARYAARYLTSLKAERGDLAAAIGRYHSSQSERQDAYRARVEGNLRWVAAALDYVRGLAEAPPRAEGRAYAWGREERGRLAFLASLYADGPVRPLLPEHGG